MAMKIYTKTGDGGMTSLLGGTKVSKSNLRIEAYGTVDELNSWIGLCRDLLGDAEGEKILLEVQDRLFTIGSTLASSPDKESKMQLPDLHPPDVQRLESEMDRMSEAIPPMRHFVLPGGHPLVSQLHIARCVCRRAERCVVRLGLEAPPENEQGKAAEALIIQYLNRLSDYLFILGRYTGHRLQVAEIPWKPRV